MSAANVSGDFEHGLSPVRHLDPDLDLSADLSAQGDEDGSVRRNEFNFFKARHLAHNRELVQSIAEVKKDAEKLTKNCQDKIWSRLQALDAAFRSECDYREESQVDLAQLLQQETLDRKAGAKTASDEVRSATSFLSDMSERMDARGREHFKEFKETFSEKLGLFESRMKKLETKLAGRLSTVSEAPPGCDCSDLSKLGHTSGCPAGSAKTSVAGSDDGETRSSSTVDDRASLPADFAERPDIASALADMRRGLDDRLAEVTSSIEGMCSNGVQKLDTMLLEASTKLQQAEVCYERRLGEASTSSDAKLAEIAAKLEAKLFDAAAHIQQSAVTEASARLTQAHVCYEQKLSEVTSKAQTDTAHFSAQLIGLEMRMESTVSERSLEERLDKRLEELPRDDGRSANAGSTDALAKLLDANLCFEDRLSKFNSKLDAGLTDLEAKVSCDLELRIEEVTARKSEGSAFNRLPVSDAQESLSEQRLCEVEATLRKVAAKLHVGEDLRLETFEDDASHTEGAQATETTGVSDSLEGDSNLEERFNDTEHAGDLASDRTPDRDRSFNSTPRHASAKVFVEADTYQCLERRVIVLERRMDNRPGVANRHFVAEPSPEMPAPREQSAPGYSLSLSL